MIHLDPAAYKASEAVSFSRLKVFDSCPYLYFKRFVSREIPDESEDTKAMRLGSAAHKLILEGRFAYALAYAIKPTTYLNLDGEDKPWNANAKLCQAWESQAEALGLTVLTKAEGDLIERMREAVGGNPDALELLRVGQAEVGIERPATALGMALKGRLDWLRPDTGTVVDLKTIECLDDLPREIERRAYYRQLAFYRHLAAEEYGMDIRCAIIGVEKIEPFRCGVYHLSSDLLEIGDAENFASLTNLAQAMTSGDWGGNPKTAEIGPSADLRFRHLEPSAQAEA